jgi:hypothetical protein
MRRWEAKSVTEYEFTLRFTLPTPDVEMDRLIDALYDHGCDDALVGIGQLGRIALDFTRAADSAHEAVLSAIADVRTAIPGVLLVEATPDLVGVSDVAAMFGCSRQNIRKLILTGSSKAPVPAHEGKSSLWHLGPLLHWLVQEKQYEVGPGLLDLADATMQVNLAMDSLRADPETQRELQVLFA